MMVYQTAFDRWIKSCEKNDARIWKLAERGTAGLYMTKKPYMQDNREVWTEPVYHVWTLGKWRTSTLSYQKAYEVWRKCRK